MRIDPLNKVKIGVSPIDGDIYIYRAGKDGAALAKRLGEPEIMHALVQHIFHGEEASKSVSKDFTLAGQWYTLTLEKIDKPHDNLNALTEQETGPNS